MTPAVVLSLELILLGDAAKVLKDFNDNCIDLTVTSPPYDNLRTYGGYTFDFEAIAKELYRVTKEGGVVVWIVGDATIDGNETGTSFKQALYFKEIGFKLHDTMVYSKSVFNKPHDYITCSRYVPAFEYMLIFSKLKPKTFNPIIDRRNKTSGTEYTRHRQRNVKGSFRIQNTDYITAEFGLRTNIWFYGNSPSTNDSDALEHPAIMAEQLAQDHIKSWSNEGDLVLDPFAGSGTTLKAAHQLNRKWIGIEINPDYVSLAKKRLTPYVQQQRLDQFTSERDNHPFQVPSLP